ncbi:hypothetical protein D0Z07_3492 [Hyphodiscus hymeniophilus]|uniref:F-box domain-containing protein n=1 Tax=Hyphodiscus hymeniophilus TaxID=353542 RepID=A0A9P6VKP1_9HELO|nr:hypothetical protein D0Z07_3492 [Hyphodiscus hymeniophilus]
METNTSASSQTKSLPATLLELLSNTLILYQTAPYIPVSSLLSLGATSKHFRALIHNTQGVFRHLDLSQVKSAQSEIGSIDHGGELWRNVQLDENVTEDDFYGGPLRGIFSILRRQNILKDVHTLILDGLAVPADLVAEIITNDSFNVCILSIRDVQHLNERKLQQALLYAVRPSRTGNTPKLRGLYIFGPRDATAFSRVKRPDIATVDSLPSYRGVLASQGAQIGAEWNKKSQEALDGEATRNSELWFAKSGRIFPKVVSLDWASTIYACRGLISFDAVICNAPRHILREESSSSAWYTQSDFHISPQAATHNLEGCSGCKSAPEGFSRFRKTSLELFPLLAPVALHSSTTKSAKAPFQGNVEKKLLLRCIEIDTARAAIVGGVKTATRVQAKTKATKVRLGRRRRMPRKRIEL